MRYLIGLLVIIAVILFIIIKLITGGSSNDSEQTSKALVRYATSSTIMRYVIDNPVQADTTHNQIIISVGRDEANLTVTRGYQGEVIRTKSYDNNEPSYANFLLALERTAGFNLGNDDSSVRDERGYCASGNRFLYEVVDGSGGVLQHYWSTSCNKEKTFRGIPGAAQSLFEAQIPDFSTLTADIDY